MLDLAGFEEALQALGDTLARRGLGYDIVCIGGAGLLLVGVTIRPTRDLDVLGFFEDGSVAKIDEFPAELKQAIADVGAAFDLPPIWMNLGPSSLLDFGMPRGFVERLETRRFGSLVLRVASPVDQVFLKVYAASDYGPESKHVEDLRRLNPTRSQVLEAARWAITHDPSPGFRRQLLGLIRFLGHEVDDGDL